MPAIDPPPVPRPRQRLDEAALQRLESLLMERSQVAMSMPLEMVDGLLTAAILSPEPVSPGECLLEAFGPDAEWSSMDAEGEAADLLGLLWNHIARRLQRDPAVDPGDDGPLIGFPDDFDFDDVTQWEQPIAAAWALGFFAGMRMRQEGWDQFMADDVDAAEAVNDILDLIPVDTWRDLEETVLAEDSDEGFGPDEGSERLDPAGDAALASRASDADRDIDPASASRADHGRGPIGAEEFEALLDEVFTGAERDQADADRVEDAGARGESDDTDQDDFDRDQDDGDFEEDDAELAAEDRRAIVESLPELLHELQLSRIAAQTPRTPVRREALPGRNDPCPCGSGRKFKKCHGDPARLH